MPTNFSSFAYGIMKGPWAKVGSNISTSLEMTGLQSWGIDFFLFLCSEVKEKIKASTLKTCHFKASGDITAIIGSETFHDTISKWPKVGRHDSAPCMISDDFKKAILLYVYYMGYIEMWVRVYLVFNAIRLIWMTIWKKLLSLNLQYQLNFHEKKDQLSQKVDFENRKYYFHHF